MHEATSPAPRPRRPARSRACGNSGHFRCESFLLPGPGCRPDRARDANEQDRYGLSLLLPFCMVFTSRDKLHAKPARLFLNSDQVFLPGDDLKADFSKLDGHYSKLPDEVKLRGVMSFAHFPPADGDFVVSRLWNQLMRPGGREYAANRPRSVRKEEQSQILAKLNKITDAPAMENPPEFSMETADSVTIKRSIPLHRGKWRMLPPEVENRWTGKSSAAIKSWSCLSSSHSSRTIRLARHSAADEVAGRRLRRRGHVPRFRGGSVGRRRRAVG